MKLKWISSLLLLLPFSAAMADPDSDIAKVTQTPFARNPYMQYYSFPFVGYVNPGYGPNNKNQDILEFKPIVTLPLPSSSYDLILRTIAPLLYHQPSMNASSPNYISGYGDINPTAFISPSRYRVNLWGLGPTLFIPTASNQALGSGKWSLGPEFAFFSMPGHWVFGILTSNVWSVAGDANRQAVGAFSFEYFVSYNFPHGWFLTTQPTITANWKAASNQRWTVPVGIGAGKSSHIGANGFSLSLQTYYNAIRPAQQGPDWTVQATVEFDFANKPVLSAVI